MLIVLAVIALFLLGGYLATGKRKRLQAADFSDHVRASDQALEQARAADKGWDREALEVAARSALASERPGQAFDHLLLVLVDDKPGKDEDQAHFMAIGGGEGARVVLARRGDSWALERVEAS